MHDAGTHDFTLPPLPARTRRVLVFIAMEAEAAPVAAALSLSRIASVAGVPARAGMVAGVETTLVSAGLDPVAGVDRIGPVHAAALLSAALREPFDLVVNLGTAGGFESQGLGIADLVLARDTMFHNARVALAGFDRIARARTRLSPSESQLSAIAARLDARVGLASTGSSLDATADEIALFARERTLAKDMELAALAVVCRMHAVPLAALKGVTDLVDHHEPAHEAFVRNLARTSRRVADASGLLIESLAAP
ncbi:MAG: hypothetical protein ACKOYN_03825 [Planctomycetota bacterium]